MLCPMGTPSLLSVLALSTLPVAAQGVAPGAAAQDEGRGLVQHTEGALEGYTLISPLSSHTIYLVDMDGGVAHTWETGHIPSGTYFQDDGHVLRCAIEPGNEVFNGGGLCGRLQKLGPDGEEVWSYLLADEERTQHHDIEELANGNILLITWERMSQDEAVALGRDPGVVGERGLWPDAVLEIEPTRPTGGKVVWEWRVRDHLIQDFDASKANHGSVPEHPERVDINADHRELPPMTLEELKAQEELEAEMRRLGYMGGDEDDAPQGGREGGPDWLHTNGIDHHAEYDLIVLSVPRLGELWVIDHSTTTAEAAGSSGGRWGKGGDLLWRWGNPRTYGAGSDADQRLFFQHDPTWLPGKAPGELRLLVYNNGQGRPDGAYSTVEELVLPFHPEAGFWREEGWPFEPTEPDWVYEDQERFYSGFISGAQRLENGNTLICQGADGRVFEVTPSGEIVWDYLSPFGGEVSPDPAGGNAPPKALFRATRIPKGHPGLAQLGLP